MVPEWINSTMTAWPFDHMHFFPWDRYTIDAEQGWIVGEVQNRFVDPGDGKVYQAPNWTRRCTPATGSSSSRRTSTTRRALH